LSGHTTLTGLLISHVGARVNDWSGRYVRTRENRERNGGSTRSLRGLRLTRKIASSRYFSTLRPVLLFSTLTADANGYEYSPDSRWTDDRKIILPHPVLASSCLSTRFPKVIIFRINASICASSTYNLEMLITNVSGNCIFYSFAFAVLYSSNTK